MSSARRTDPTPEALAHIVQNLRAPDLEEVAATSYDVWPSVWERLCAVRANQSVWEVDGVPAAVMGAWPLWPGMWTVYAMGTEAFPAVTMTKFALRVMVPALMESGARRAECASIATHTVAHRWLEGLGAHRESEMPNYGKGGETFYRYVWSRNAQL